MSKFGLPPIFDCGPENWNCLGGWILPPPIEQLPTHGGGGNGNGGGSGIIQTIQHTITNTTPPLQQGTVTTVTADPPQPSVTVIQNLIDKAKANPALTAIGLFGIGFLIFKD